MASRYCLHCQGAFGDGTGKAKYCSAKCRKAAFLQRQGTGDSPATHPAPIAARRAPGVDSLDSLAATVRAEIGEAAARTVAGVSALLIAQQLDFGEEKGAAVAALSKQLQTLVAECKRGPGAEVDLIDELAARRAV